MENKFPGSYNADGRLTTYIGFTGLSLQYDKGTSGTAIGLLWVDGTPSGNFGLDADYRAERRPDARAMSRRRARRKIFFVDAARSGDSDEIRRPTLFPSNPSTAPRQINESEARKNAIFIA